MRTGPEPSVPSAESAIGHYQAVLLDLLYEGSDGGEMADQLQRAAEDFGVDLGPIDATLLEVAADLTRQWGRRS